MGMDVYGTEPSSEVGTYFRDNIWGWRPLWNYCAAIAPDLIDADGARRGHYNDGWGLDAAGAVALAARLRAEIETGRTAAFAAARSAEIAAMPRRSCGYCRGTGVRIDAVGWEMEMPYKVRTDGGTGWCNGCDGEGTTPPDEAGYTFDVENVRMFADFLAASGGFSIY